MRLVALFAAAATAVAAAPAATLIVPGKQIGPARLGSTRSELGPILQDTTCPIRALFQGDMAVQLYTNCGGAWATAGGAQVGMPLRWAVREFGHPEARVPGATYTWPGNRTAKAVWYLYQGVAFRAVVPGDEPEPAGVVTCITVYTGSRPALSESCGQELD